MSTMDWKFTFCTKEEKKQVSWSYIRLLSQNKFSR